MSGEHLDNLFERLLSLVPAALVRLLVDPPLSNLR
jgi:hypothetical protein